MGDAGRSLFFGLKAFFCLFLRWEPRNVMSVGRLGVLFFLLSVPLS
jgi:hypothetical protein